MKLRLKHIALCLLTTVLAGCGEDAGYVYSSYHCNLYLDNNSHADFTLQSAMNSGSPGTYCTITYKYQGAYLYVFSSNLGGAATQSYFDQIDLNRSNQQRIGMNNGIIVGFGNLNYPYEFYAFDAECPNCFDLNALPVKSYKLSVSSAGIATCATCKRTYNLNTGGNLVSGTGKPMTRYRASTTGPLGMLSVY